MTINLIRKQTNIIPQNDYSEIVDIKARMMHLRKQITNLMNSFSNIFYFLSFFIVTHKKS